MDRIYLGDCELGQNCHYLVSLAALLSSSQNAVVPHGHNLETTELGLNVITLSISLGSV